MLLGRFSARRMTYVRSISRAMSLAHSIPTRVRVPDKMEVRLTRVENEICGLLDECTKWIKEERGIETSCRIAGGWVRDKLLGSDSNDIDVALTSMMGMTFAEHFVSYCSTVKRVETDKIAKIEVNPDRSKHLETAKTTILGVELDFVNLRSEEYAEDSRIPTQVTFGTPLQDALRRDITINALFYNVHTRCVEDHTKKGLDDLRSGIIRTPLPPRETFMDDPLRVLRCLRFASRFGFELITELQKSARDPDIQTALKSKISRERVGEELDKMMKGPDPRRAIQLINDFGLYDAIFYVPATIAPLSGALGPHQTAVRAASILHLLTQQSSGALPELHSALRSAFSHEHTTRPRMYLACALTPFKGLTYTDAKQKQHPALEAAIREGLKLGVQNHYLDGIPALFAAAELLKGPPAGGQKERKNLGLLLRDKFVHNPHTGSFWATSLLFSLVQELVPLWNATEDSLDLEEAAAIINAYNHFVCRIEELDLPSAVDARPIVDGRDVVRILEAGKPGPWTGQVLSRVIEWQLDNPEGTKADCEEWLKVEKARGNIDIAPGTSPRPTQSKRGQAYSQSTVTKKIRTTSAPGPDGSHRVDQRSGNTHS